VTRTEEAIVLVGGQGTRLRAAVPDVPKPLAPVAGRPFLAWVLDALAEQGIRRVVLATGYGADRILQAVGARWRGMTLVHSPEPRPLGTGGAVALARASLQGDRAHVLNGDTFHGYAPFELERHAQKHNVPIAISLARVDDVSRYGAVRLEGALVRGFSEKGGHGAGLINAGCYYLGPEALGVLPDGAYSFEADVLVPAAARGEVVGLESDGQIHRYHHRLPIERLRLSKAHRG